MKKLFSTAGLALAISIVALLFAVLRIMPCEITTETYIGILVSLLGIIVTFVVAYQIYNNIDFRENAKEFKRLKRDLFTTREELQNELKRAKKELIIFKAETENMRGVDNKNAGKYLMALCHYMRGMHYALIGESEIEMDKIIHNSKLALNIWDNKPPKDPFKTDVRFDDKHPKELILIKLNDITSDFDGNELFKKFEFDFLEIKRRIEEKITDHEKNKEAQQQ